MTAAGIKNFKLQAVGIMKDALAPGSVIIAGHRYHAAVRASSVSLVIDGAGTVERRGIVVLVLKSDLRAEPPVDVLVTHEERDYILNSLTGREDHEIHWRLVCIEKDHT